MKGKITILLLFLVQFLTELNAQYMFSGYVEDENVQGTAYLSLIDDYRKMNGIFEEQVIQKVNIKGNYFEFNGDNLENQNRLYRIHIDSCSGGETNKNHFNGSCEFSSHIIFIANNKDTINFPSSFEDQMFCSISSKNAHSKAVFKIDSLKELMAYDYSNFRSEANRQLNNKKWFSKLQDFGEDLEEPLAELYVYNFLSDRSTDLHSYYIKDVQSNSYYESLLERLKTAYPETSYTKQYTMELASDKFATSNGEHTFHFPWKYVLGGLLMLSLFFNLFFWSKWKGSKQLHKEELKEQLTKQEQKIVNLILQDKTNKEIAQEIFVSVSTVKTHINNIYKKLNISSREDVKVLLNS